MFKINDIRNKIDCISGFEVSNIYQFDEKYHKKRTDLFVFIDKSLIFKVLNIGKKGLKKDSIQDDFRSWDIPENLLNLANRKI